MPCVALAVNGLIFVQLGQPARKHPAPQQGPTSIAGQ
jgi:hypothetical protein